MRLNAENRWTARPRLALAVRAAALLIPVAMSFGAALGSQRLFDNWFPAAPWVVGAIVSLAIAMLTLVIGERIGRRFLPLAMLLKLALLFPDQVPSRLAISLRAASPRRLARKLASEDAIEANAAERVLALVSALSAHDRLTRGHCERVRAVSMLIADEMGIAGEDRDKLEWAALLHDVGKIRVSPAILNKRGKPTDAEWAELRTHPGEGAPLAIGLAEWMGDWVHAIDQHHERFDGSGYPLGLSGSEISKAARIVSAADAFEVMTAVRSYKAAMPVAEARAELAACQGSHFDPIVVRSFASLSVNKLHRALGPASWAMSLPFRGFATQAMRGATALLGGAAPTALAGMTAVFVMAVATTSMADAVDGRFIERERSIVIETADAALAEGAPGPANLSQASLSTATPPGADPSGTSSSQSAGGTDDEGAGPSSDTSDDDSSGSDEADTATNGRGDRGASDDSTAPGTADGDDGGGKRQPGAVDLAGVDLNSLTQDELNAVADLLGVDVTSLVGDNLSALDNLVSATGKVLPGVTDEALASVTTLLKNAGVEIPVVNAALDTVGTVTDATFDTVNGVTNTVTSTVNEVTGVVAGTVDKTVPVTQIVGAVDGLVDATGVAVPTVAIPTVVIPTVAIPTVAIPTVAIPTVAIPTVAVPTVVIPTVAVPTVAIPTVAVPTVAVPTQIPIVGGVTSGLGGSSQPGATATPKPTTAPSPTAAPIAVPTVVPTAVPQPTPTPIIPVIVNDLVSPPSGLGGLLGG